MSNSRSVSSGTLSAFKVQSSNENKRIWVFKLLISTYTAFWQTVYCTEIDNILMFI